MQLGASVRPLRRPLLPDHFTTAVGVCFVLSLFALAAIIFNRYSRLARMAWESELHMSRRGDSVLDRAGAALREQRSADMPFTAVAAVFGGVDRRLKTAFAPIGECS